jgi:hypothetical protein
MTPYEINELREELNKETVKFLRNLANLYSIVGRHDMRKQQLINAIISAEKSHRAEPVDRMIKESLYIAEAKKGTHVAFKSGKNERIVSAKVVSNNIGKRTLQVQTIRGKTISVPYENVLWVKTGKRWPRGVYELLKR